MIGAARPWRVTPPAGAHSPVPGTGGGSQTMTIIIVHRWAMEARSGRLPFSKLDVLHRHNLDFVLRDFGLERVDEEADANAGHLALSDAK